MDYIPYLLRAAEIAQEARDAGNTPFGALLIDPEGKIIEEQGNIEITEKICTGHAECTLAAKASHKYSKDFLWNCTLVTSVEPCSMCTGAIYWANIGTIVYGIEETELLKMTGDNEQNPTFNLPCRKILECGQKPIKVYGPFPEVAEACAKAHIGYWD
ncbi:MAG: nucleoside deaminase [Blautia sp.]|nr:nucleoside deaminase [Blautia sp.]